MCEVTVERDIRLTPGRGRSLSAPWAIDNLLRSLRSSGLRVLVAVALISLAAACGKVTDAGGGDGAAGRDAGGMDAGGMDVPSDTGTATPDTGTADTSS